MGCLLIIGMAVTGVPFSSMKQNSFSRKGLRSGSSPMSNSFIAPSLALGFWNGVECDDYNQEHTKTSTTRNHTKHYIIIITTAPARRIHTTRCRDWWAEFIIQSENMLLHFHVLIYIIICTNLMLAFRFLPNPEFKYSTTGDNPELNISS